MVFDKHIYKKKKSSVSLNKTEDKNTTKYQYILNM